MAFTLSDFLRTRIHQQRQPSPLLQFYEVALPDGGFFRVVDFADKDAGGSLPDKTPFNGVEFSAVPIQRGEFQESAEGGSFRMPITIEDPTHAVAFYLRQFGGLRGQAVTWWLTTYDNIANPADAYKETLEVISSIITQGPDTATLLLGHPNLYETRIPKQFYSDRKCPNAYHNRFVLGNLCSYPSNEFGAQKSQDLLPTAAYENQAQKFGWMSQQARKASKFNVDLTTAGTLTIESVESRIAWKSRDRYGPNFYRPLSGDLDVEILVTVAGTARTQWMAGLLCQDMAPAAARVAEGEEAPASPMSSWLFWGIQDNGAGSRRLLRRSAVASVSPADSTVAVTDGYLRLARVGDAFTLYSKASAGAAWSSRFSSVLVLPSAVQIGLVLASDQRAAVQVLASFDYIRFAAGGLPACLRTWEDCDVHGNRIQFNGFREMPSDRSRN